MLRNLTYFILSFVLLASAACEDVPEADLIFWGGTIYTANDKRPKVEVVAVKDGKIIFVGNVSPGRKFAGPNTQLIELKENVLYPGFADAHVHLKGVGEREMSLNLAGTGSLWDMREAIEDWVWDYPSAPLITGRGWIETHWPEAVFPTRFEIDAVTDGKPALMVRADGHALLANSAALAMAGIGRNTVAPPGGEILRFSNGEPTGMLIDNAMMLVAELKPEQDLNDTMFAFDRAFEVYASRGWVHAHNMSPALKRLSFSKIWHRLAETL